MDDSLLFFFSSRRRHTRYWRDWSSDVCSSDLVPNIVFEVVAGGALASLVVPMLAGGIATGDRQQVRRTASALLGWSLLVLTPLAVLLAVCAEPVARLLLGSQDPVQVDLAARFLVVFAPQVVLYGIEIVLTGEIGRASCRESV